MRLTTVREAAGELFVSVPLVHHWVRTGRISKHPYPLAAASVKVRKYTESPRRYLVDMDEIQNFQRARTEAELKLSNSDKRLLRPAEIAKLLDVKIERVYSWTKRFELKRYPSGYGLEFFLDGDELADNLEDTGLGHLIK